MPAPFQALNFWSVRPAGVKRGSKSEPSGRRDTKQAIVDGITSARVSSKTLSNTAQKKQFLQQYVENVPVEDLQGRSEAIMARAALDHLEFGAKRRRGQALLRIFNPTEKSTAIRRRIPSSKWSTTTCRSWWTPSRRPSTGTTSAVDITVHPIISS